MHCSWQNFAEPDDTTIAGYQWALTGNEASQDLALLASATAGAGVWTASAEGAASVPFAANVIGWSSADAEQMDLRVAADSLSYGHLQASNYRPPLPF